MIGIFIRYASKTAMVTRPPGKTPHLLAPMGLARRIFHARTALMETFIHWFEADCCTCKVLHPKPGGLPSRSSCLLWAGRAGAGTAPRGQFAYKNANG